MVVVVAITAREMQELVEAEAAEAIKVAAVPQPQTLGQAGAALTEQLVALAVQAFASLSIGAHSNGTLCKN